MILDIELLSHLVFGDQERLESCRIDKNLVTPDVFRVIEFLQDYMDKNKRMPSGQTIFSEFGIQTYEPTSDFEYILKQVKDREFYSVTKSELVKLQGLLTNKEYDKILNSLDPTVDRIRAACSEDADLEDLFDKDKNQEAFDFYLKRKNGEYGVITPWPSLNESTFGWQPGDFVLVGARSGVGKTWILLLMALHAFKEGKHVFFVSPEMSRVSLVNRLASLELKINYNNIRKGELSTAQEDMYRNFLLKHDNALNDRFHLFSDKFEMEVEGLKSAIARKRPHIVFIDGVYLLRTKKESDRMRRAPIIADELKQMAKRYGVPIVASTQFNKEAIKLKLKEITVGNYVLSDAYAWNIDWGFALGREENSKEERQMVLRYLKTREGDYSKPIILNWDFDAHNFSEFTKEEETVNPLDIPF